MNKYKYKILDLDCANCAKEVEEGLNKDERLNNVIVNFSTSKISFESDNEISLEELNRLVKNIEPDARVTSLEDVKQNKEYHILNLVLGVVLGVLGTLVTLPFKLNKILVIIGYILLLYRPFINAVKTLVRNKTINENALITISCVGAFLLGDDLEGIMVVALYILGKILEEKAINNTRRSIKDLLDIKQDYTNKLIGENVVKVDVEQVKRGDILIVKKGEKIPVDGIITKGSTLLDTSALTGESLPVNVGIKDKVLSGTINIGDIIYIKADAEFKDSTVAKILELVEDASDKKAHTETLVSRLSKIYTPLVLILAVLVVIVLSIFTNVGLGESIYRGLTFLVISCPCAIAISVPLSYFTGIGVSSKNGILVKGSNYLDNLSRVNKIVFDKTGTLTTGTFNVQKIKIYDDSYTEEQIIEILIKGESLSNHPIAQSLIKFFDKKYTNKDVKAYKELTGKGIEYDLGENHIKVGTVKLCDDCSKEASLHVNINGKHIASIIIDDGIKENAKSFIEKLHKAGITTYMFTGDKKSTALEIQKKLGIENVEYEMLPNDKYCEYEKIKSDNDVIAFVGDGINDAPLLKRADIGISMGGIGSSSAIEASDIVIMNDDLEKINKGIDISKYTNKIIKQNLIFAISVKIIILSLSVFGITTMWWAVFADTGVTLITILNTLKIMKKFNK